MSEQVTTAAPPRRASPVRVALVVVGLSVVVIAATVAFLWYRHHNGVSTDDAFVRASVSRVSPDVGGRVVEVLVAENQHVTAGDVLVRIDDAPYTLALSAAEATLAAAEADALRATAGSGAAEAQVKLAEAQLTEARREEKLQTELVAAGSSVRSVLERAKDGVRVAEAAASAARQTAASADAAATAATAHVEAARSAVELARRDVAHTVVVAPVTGTATRVETVAGDWLRPGQALFAVVPDEIYVVANFKETQIGSLAPGDPVDLWVDAYPDLRLHGHVDSIGAGTASAFSLLPADNPSGNFVKVVQRVPVRIAVDPSPRPLAVGLSVEVRVRPGAHG